MKTKTINKVIKAKLNEWLETITDEKLREDVKNNILVSGGAIASMLLKEDVNDYDVYIQDMDVLVRLAQYYSPGAKTVLDGRLRLDYLSKEYPDIDHNNPICPFTGEKYVAEKYVMISNLKENQVKLRIGGAGMRIKQEEGTKYLPVFFSQNAISLQDDIQIVLRFNGNPEQIHKTFDFIHATNYFTFEDNLVLNKEALESLITKNLVYQGSLYPLTSIIRMKKFISRHWTINAGEILKIMFQISELNLRDIEVLEEQLIGVDVAYFALLIEALRSVESSSITPSFINNLIDKIFNEYED
jgi:hypothetical protein